MKSARERMDMIAASSDVGSYREAAAFCGCDPKTVKRAVERAQRRVPRVPMKRPRNTDGVAEVVAKRVEATGARVSAKRLLPEAQAAGFGGSAPLAGSQLLVNSLCELSVVSGLPP
jgi:hypothetical protein